MEETPVAAAAGGGTRPNHSPALVTRRMQPALQAAGRLVRLQPNWGRRWAGESLGPANSAYFVGGVAVITSRRPSCRVMEMSNHLRRTS